MSRIAQRIWLASILLSTTAEKAIAIVVPLSFQGSNQSFDSTLDLTANLTTTLTGQAYNAVSKSVEPFTTTAPFSHSANYLDGPYPFSGAPSSDSSLNPTMELSGYQLANINSLKLDLLGSETVPLAIDPISVTTSSKISILKNLVVEMSADINALRFEQTASGTFQATGPGQGKFSLPGLALAEYSNVQMYLGGAIPVPLGIGDEIGATAINLTGTYKLSGPAGSAKLELDGSGTYLFDILHPRFGSPDVISYAIDTPLALTVSGSVNYGVTTAYQIRYHFEQTGIIVPEPGAATLLFAGLILLALFVSKGRRLPTKLC